MEKEELEKIRHEAEDLDIMDPLAVGKASLTAKDYLMTRWSPGGSRSACNLSSSNYESLTTRFRKAI